jgi:hypothetical protein
MGAAMIVSLIRSQQSIRKAGRLPEIQRQQAVSRYANPACLYSGFAVNKAI